MCLWEAGLKAEEIAAIVGLSVQHVRKRSAAHRKLSPDTRAQLRAEGYRRKLKLIEGLTLDDKFGKAKAISDALARLARSQQIVEREMAKSGIPAPTSPVEEIKADDISASELDDEGIAVLRDRIRSRILSRCEPPGSAQSLAGADD